MTNAFKDEDEEKPLDPAMENIRRKMIRLLGVSIGVMIAGLMAVLAAIVYKMNSGGAGLSAQGEAVSAEIALPKGAYLNSQSLSGDRIALDVTLQGGAREIAIYDMESRRIIARFAVNSD